MADEQTPDATAETTTEPVVHKHSERLLRICDSVGISREEAAGYDGDALRREIQDAQTELSIQQARRPQPTARQPVPESQDDEDEDYQFDNVNLDDLGTETAKALKQVGKDAAKVRKLEAELKRIREEQANDRLRAQVNAAIAGLPPVQFGTKDARDRAIWAELIALDQAGQLVGMNHDQAVQLAYRNLYGGAPLNPAAPTPTKPVATPTAKPVTRLNPTEEAAAARAVKNQTPDGKFVP